MQPSLQSKAETPLDKSEISREEKTSKEASIRRSNLPNEVDQTIIDVLGDMKQEDKNMLENFESPMHEETER